jgi:hypothetical protein
MRVTSVRTVLVTAPWTGDPFWAAGDSFAPDGGVFQRSAALIVVETDEGVTGLGETIMGYFAPDTVVPIVDYYARLLVDLRLDPCNPEACWRELYQRSLWWGRVGLGLSVLSGVEMALWDIAGKVAGRPVHELLGGPAHDRLPLYASGGTGSWPVERTVEQAVRYNSLGFRGLKLGTGFDGRPGGYTTPPGTRRTGPGTRARRPSGSPTNGRNSGRCGRRSVRPSNSRPTPTRSRSASRGRAPTRSTSPTRSNRSTCCSSRNRCATTTPRAMPSFVVGRASRSPAASA